MNKKLAIVACFIVGPLCFGQECPDQVFLDPNSIPFQYDPNIIPIDPASGERGILNYIIGEVGSPISAEGYWCDPDNDKTTLTVSAGTLSFPTINTYTWNMTPTSISVIPVTFTLTDEPFFAQLASETRKGTLLIASVPKNKPPVLCGGKPPSVNPFIP